MSKKIDATQEKRIVREYILRLLQRTVRPISNRPDLIVSGDDSLLAFITFSNSDNLFYDVGGSDLREWSDFKSAFIIFVLGSRDACLVIPVKELRSKLIQANRTPSEKYGDYKLHIINNSPMCLFREIPGWDLRKYFNNFLSLVSTEVA